MLELLARVPPVARILILAAAVFLVFHGALRAPFQYDDYAILADPAITSAGGWIDVWRPSQTRPLTYFTFWLNWRAGGASPAGFHAVNLALHMLSTVLVMLCLERAIPREGAWIAALIFGLHPIQTEAVVYVFARSTLLATCLTLSALLCWLRGRHWLATAVFALAMLAKEECAAFPAVLLLMHLSNSFNKTERAPIAAMFAIAVMLTARLAWIASTTPGSGAGVQSGITPWAYFQTQGFVILRYLRMLAIPAGFTVDPDIVMITGWMSVVCWAAVLFVAWVATRYFTRLRGGFWLICGLLLLLPTSSIFPAQDLAADRRVYLPMLGFAAFAGQSLRQTAFPPLLWIGTATMCLLSFTRVDVWKSEQSLWEDAMRWAPEKVRPRLQLARASDPERAIRLLEDARKIAPSNADVPSELGRLYLMMGRNTEALTEFGRVLAMRLNDPLALNNRGAALLALGLKEAAATDFGRALVLDPCLFEARLNLRRAGAQTDLPQQCRFSDEQLRRFQEAP